MDERRSHTRARLPLEMRWEGQSGKHTARIYEVSLNGCYIESLGQVTIGEGIALEVQLPTGRWLPFQGDVIHSQPGMGFGLGFVNLTRTQSDMLTQLVEYARALKE